MAAEERAVHQRYLEKAKALKVEVLKLEDSVEGVQEAFLGIMNPSTIDAPVTETVADACAKLRELVETHRDSAGEAEAEGE